MTPLRKAFVSLMTLALMALISMPAFELTGQLTVKAPPEASRAPASNSAPSDQAAPQAVRALLRSSLLAERATSWTCQAYATKNQRPLERAAGAADAAADYLISQNPVPTAAALADRFSSLAVKLREGAPKTSSLGAIERELQELADLSTELTTAETALWESYQSKSSEPPTRAPAAKIETGWEERALPMTTLVLSVILLWACLTAAPPPRAVSKETVQTLDGGFVITTSETPAGRVATGFTKRA